MTHHIDISPFPNAQAVGPAAMGLSVSKLFYFVPLWGSEWILWLYCPPPSSYAKITSKPKCLQFENIEMAFLPKSDKI